MKRPLLIKPASLLVAALIFSLPLRAGYVFTSLDLMSTDTGGDVAVSGNNVVVTFGAAHVDPTSFLYTGGAYKLIDDIAYGSETATTSLDGSNVVGTVKDNSGVGHGFLYSGGTFTILTYPGAKETGASAISGSNIIGIYQDSGNIGHAYLYNGGVYTAINYPGAVKTGVSAISGSNIVGTYKDTSGILNGFVYNNGVYTQIFYPGSAKTGVGAISGNNIVGVYQPTSASQGGRGFLYNGGTYTDIMYPGSTQTVVSGISGSTIVGSYVNGSPQTMGMPHTNFNAIPHGFIYSGGTYTSIDFPGSRRTAITGISGTNIVGGYEDINFLYHGFFATPATQTLALGGNLAFGNVVENTTATATLTITNTGNSTLTISGIAFPTGFSGRFSGPLGPGSVADVTVTFTPTAVTSYGGNIVVTSSATGSPTSIAVSGAGVEATSNLAKPTAPTPVTFAQWQAQYDLVGAATATPLNDGVPNLLKYLYDIDPTAPMSQTDQSALPSVKTETSGGVNYLTLTYRQNAEETGVTVNIQTSTDLQTWTTVNPPDFSQQVNTDPTTGDPIMEVGVKTTGSAQQFIRLNVTSP